jgi:hypothetical protein
VAVVRESALSIRPKHIRRQHRNAAVVQLL